MLRAAPPADLRAAAHLDALLTVRLVVQQQLALQQEALPAVGADLHAVVCDIHVLLQVPAVVEDAGALLTGEVLLLLQPHLLDRALGVQAPLAPPLPHIGQ